jgi:transcriptional regulator with XRE-family HTH domain
VTPLPLPKRNLRYYLRTWRSRHALNQEQAAAYLGISRSYLAMLETGERTNVGPDLAPKLVAETGMPLPVALGDVEEAE